MRQEASRAAGRAGDAGSSPALGKERQGQAQRDLQKPTSRWPPQRYWGSYLLRGLGAAPGHLGSELAPERLWRALAAWGGAKWAPTWPGTRDFRQRSGSHRALGLWS